MGIPLATQAKRVIIPVGDGYDSTDPDGEYVPPTGEGDFVLDGVLGDGNPLTITVGGAYFDVKDQTATPIYDNFNYTSGELLESENPDWISYLSHSGALLTNDLSRTGGVAAYNSSDRNEFDTNHHVYAQSGEVYSAHWFYFEADTNGGEGSDYAVGKLIRLTSSEAAGGGGVYNGNGSLAISNMQPRTADDPYVLHTTGGAAAQTPPEGNCGYLSVPFNTWVRIDLYAKQNTPENADGVIWARSIGYGSRLLENRILRADGQTFLFDTVLLGLMMANVEGDGMRMLIDEIYVDRGANAAARFELQAGTTWSDTAHKEIQPYTDWSTSSVEITLNYGSLTGECGLFYVPASGDPVRVATIDVGGV